MADRVEIPTIALSQVIERLTERRIVEKAVSMLGEAPQGLRDVFELCRSFEKAFSNIVNQLQQEQQQQQQRAPGSLTAGLQPLSDEQLEWFRARGIEREVLEANGVMGARRYCGALGQSVDHIAFPYAKDGAVVNVKYRALPKHFSQSKGGEQVFYGYDGARGAQELIIVEGELDKLSVEQALLKQEQAAAAAAAEAGGPPQPRPRRAVLSVPAGAPSRGAGPATSLERKFRYVDACSDILSAAERVILAVDSDGPGVVLAGELARRIGRERCCLVAWPTARENSLAPPDAPRGQAGDWARKDANEVLLKDGEQVLAAYIDAAKPLPIRGLFRFDEFWEQVYDLYQQGPKGLSWGVSTGWESVDACYKVVPGELTLVTGLPNSGKSEWLDALAVNLAQLHGWRIGLCSLENSPREHGRKLMEKYTGKAFFDAPYAAGTAKMGFEELVDALVWLDGHFHIIRPPKDSVPTIEYILERARAAVLRYGITGLIIDPYNELDHRRPAALSETEHVSMLLTKVKRFAQHYDVHVWFVAHPRTQRGLGTGGGTASLSAPTMYDISGSAHFINKADNGIVVHRPGTAGGRADPCGVQLLVRKVRNKLAGRVGDVALTYSRATGRYVDDPVEGRAD